MDQVILRKVYLLNLFYFLQRNCMDKVCSQNIHLANDSKEEQVTRNSQRIEWVIQKVQRGLKGKKLSNGSTKVYDIQQSTCLHFPRQNFVRNLHSSSHKVLNGCMNQTPSCPSRNKLLSTFFSLQDMGGSNSHNFSVFYVN